MKSSKILGLAVASVLGTASAGVMAAVELGATTAQTPSYYAAEFNIENNGTKVSPPVSDAPWFKINYSVQQGNKIYARVDLTGATIGDVAWSSTANAVLVPYANDGITEVAAANISSTLVEGGATTAPGNTYAIFEVSAVLGGIATDNQFKLCMSGGAAPATANGVCDLVSTTATKLTLTPSGGVSARVRIYNGLTAAQVPDHATSVAVKDYSGTILGYKEALVLKTTPKTNTALVAKEYKELATGGTYPAGTTATKAQLGYFQLHVPADVTAGPIVMDKLGVGIANVSSLLTSAASGTTLTVKGDFSLAKNSSGAVDLTKVVLYQNLLTAAVAAPAAGCAGTALNAKSIAADFTSATFAFEGGAGMTIGSGDYTVCYDFGASNAVAIPEGNYTFDLTAVTSTDYVASKLSKSAQSLGNITRDGVVLRSGFISKNGVYGADGVRIGGQSRFIIANTGATSANITSVKFYVSTGEVAPTLKLTTPYELKAGTRNFITMDQLVGNLANVPANLMVEFGIGSEHDKIFGTYQLLLNGSPVQTVVPLERPASAFK